WNPLRIFLHESDTVHLDGQNSEASTFGAVSNFARPQRPCRRAPARQTIYFASGARGMLGFSDPLARVSSKQRACGRGLFLEQKGTARGIDHEKTARVNKVEGPGISILWVGNPN